MAATAVAGEEQGRLVEAEPTAVVVEERRPAGEEKRFRPYDADQVLLMAPVLSEWIPEGDLAHFVSDLVESGTLDLSAIYADYGEERGSPPTPMGSSPRASWSGRPIGMWRCGCCAPTSIRTTARSPAFGRAIWRRWGSCLCRRCGCAGGRGWSGWGRWRLMGRSCARTPRATRR